jgi:microfibrillar-associated protein 1
MPEYPSDDSEEIADSNKSEIKQIPINTLTIGGDILQGIESNDKRLLRLGDKIHNNNQNIEERLKHRREIYKSEIVSNTEVEATRPKETREELKQKLLEEHYKAKVVEADDELLELLGNDEDGDKSVSEEEEVDIEQEQVLLRPVFVRKENRLTMMDDDELVEEGIDEDKERLKHVKKEETRHLVKQYIEKEANKVEKNAEDSIMPDDSDDVNAQQEYENWKIRELRRIKNSLEEDEVRMKERIEVERRRQLTDEQRKEENLRLGCDESLRPVKSKLNFLQKYYHKGAFYQAEASSDPTHVLNRDYNLPTWQDKIDRSGLPKIMQKRRGTEFKKGQSKYTHLTDQDTTNFDPKWRVPDVIANNQFNKMAGFKGKDQFDLTGRKRKNN